MLLVTAMRDEGPHLVEWVAHHRALGVTDLLVFSNDCADGTDALLDALAPAGVTHLPNRPAKGKSLQWNALREAWKHPLRKAADWILCIDADEFVNLRPPLASLADLVAASGDPDAIVLPWRLFGHAGQTRLSDHPTTQVFTRAAPPDCAYPVAARQFKTLFRAKGPFRQIGVHRPRLKSGAAARWADGSGRAMPAAFAEAEPRINLHGLPLATDLVQLNHYSVRSAQSFLLKRARGLPNRATKPIDLSYWVERNFNAVEDTSISVHARATAEEQARLMALDGVARLHRAAHDHHHAAFETAMRDRATVKFYGRLLLAAGSTPPPPRLAAELIARYGAADD